MTRTLLVPALLALLALPACSLSTTEIGRPLPEPRGLEIGRTTKAEALARLGPPHVARRQFDGDLYSWQRTVVKSRELVVLPVYVRAFHYADKRSRRDDLSLLFDREGVLRGIGRRLETGDAD